jgi:twitching motility two-component system response regulator PilH
MAILVADDSVVERTHLQTILEKQGKQVILASSGAEGITLAKQHKPEMIFLDIVMGEMDGYKVCRAITKDDATKGIPVVMVSSKKNKADKIWATAQGATDYVVKPYEDESILECLKKYAP